MTIYQLIACLIPIAFVIAILCGAPVIYSAGIALIVLCSVICCGVGKLVKKANE